jgi:hypothetical protein
MQFLDEVHCKLRPRYAIAARRSAPSGRLFVFASHLPALAVEHTFRDVPFITATVRIDAGPPSATFLRLKLCSLSLSFTSLTLALRPHFREMYRTRYLG